MWGPRYGLTGPEALRRRGWRDPGLWQPPPSLRASPRPPVKTRGPSGVTTGLGSAERTHKACPTQATAMPIASLPPRRVAGFPQTTGRERDTGLRGDALLGAPFLRSDGPR